MMPIQLSLSLYSFGHFRREAGHQCICLFFALPSELGFGHERDRVAVCGNTFIGSSIKPISFCPSRPHPLSLCSSGGLGGLNPTAATAPAAQCAAKWNFLPALPLREFLLAGIRNEERKFVRKTEFSEPRTDQMAKNEEI